MDRGSNEEECILLGIFGGFFSFSLESNETFFVVLQRFFFFFLRDSLGLEGNKKGKEKRDIFGKVFLGVAS